MTSEALSFRPLTPVFGAEVSGIDIGDCRDTQIAELSAALEEYSALVLHAQPMDDDLQLAFTSRLGPLEDSLVDGVADDGDYFGRFSNVTEGGVLLDIESPAMRVAKGNQRWHTDSSFKAVPAKASVLSGRIVPPEGGETEFASARAAYDALPDERRRALAQIICVHDLACSRGSTGTLTERQKQAYPPVRNRLVRVNPVNGRRNLFVGTHVARVEGMNEEQGLALMEELTAFATQPEFTYCHRWAAGDIVIWDNRCVLHRGRPWNSDRYGRAVYRTTIAGDMPTLEEPAPV